MVLATVLLHRVEPDKAREFLAELETEPEIVEAVLELLAGQGAERDLNRQLFQDVLALLEEKGEAPRQFATRTAQRLAEAAEKREIRLLGGGSRAFGESPFPSKKTEPQALPQFLTEGREGMAGELTSSGPPRILSSMSPTILPPAAAVARLLIWHQGALGDLLLAGPALAALSRHYAGARITALGHPERWGLYSRSLPLDAVWDSGEARWVHLFSDGDVPPPIKARLARFQLALVFSPHPQTILQARLRQAGIPAVHWLPSFPETGAEAVAALQARHLAGLGLALCPRPLQTGGGTVSG